MLRPLKNKQFRLPCDALPDTALKDTIIRHVYEEKLKKRWDGPLSQSSRWYW